MKITTDHVDNDELCHGLQEVNRMVPQPDGSQDWRRLQCVYVVRGDTIAEYAKDLGPSRLFDVPEIKILALADKLAGETVGNLIDEAERTRRDDFASKLRDYVRDSSTLISDFIQEKEENWERIKNRSHFGPNYTKQRNGFDGRDLHQQALSLARQRERGY